MICDDCTKKDVCRFTDEAKCYEETVETIIQDGKALFSTVIQCKHKDNGQRIKTSFPSQPLIGGTYPYTPNTTGRTPRVPTTITYSSGGGDFRDDVNRESQSEYFGK